MQASWIQFTLRKTVPVLTICHSLQNFHKCVCYILVEVPALQAWLQTWRPFLRGNSSQDELCARPVLDSLACILLLTAI